MPDCTRQSRLRCPEGDPGSRLRRDEPTQFTRRANRPAAERRVAFVAPRAVRILPINSMPMPMAPMRMAPIAPFHPSRRRHRPPRRRPASTAPARRHRTGRTASTRRKGGGKPGSRAGTAARPPDRRPAGSRASCGQNATPQYSRWQAGHARPGPGGATRACGTPARFRRARARAQDVAQRAGGQRDDDAEQCDRSAAWGQIHANKTDGDREAQNHASSRGWLPAAAQLFFLAGFLGALGVTAPSLTIPARPPA